MFTRAALYSERMKLARELAKRFTVRWHAYEYIILSRGEVAVILIEPYRSRIHVVARSQSKDFINSILSCVKKVFPECSIEVSIREQ